MLKVLRIIALAALAAVLPLSALAGIDNTHHDMAYMLGNATGAKCSYCHSKTNITITAQNLTDYGNVGAFCVQVCHGSDTYTGFQEAVPQTVNLAVYNDNAGAPAFTVSTNLPYSPNVVAFTGSHGNRNAAMPAGDSAAGVGASNFPHTSSSDTAEIECTSCHAVHDNTFPPFLNSALSTGNATTAFCSRCHTGQGYGSTAKRFKELGTGKGAHPVEFAWDATAAATRGRTIPANKPRASNMYVAPTVVTTIDNKDSIWKVGGHLISTGLPSATTGTFGCYTCHSAHSQHSVVGNNPGYALPLVGNVATVCYACHGGGTESFGSSTTTAENPGTTAYYHPVNSENGATGHTWPMSTNFTNLTAGSYRVDADSPTCVSCHLVHGGIASRYSLRFECLDCHQGTGTSSTNRHHPTGTADYSQTANGGYPTATGWGASLTDGMSCTDCHPGFGNSAHNWQ